MRNIKWALMAGVFIIPVRVSGVDDDTWYDPSRYQSQAAAPVQGVCKPGHSYAAANGFMCDACDDACFHRNAGTAQESSPGVSAPQSAPRSHQEIAQDAALAGAAVGLSGLFKDIMEDALGIGPAAEARARAEAERKARLAANRKEQVAQLCENEHQGLKSSLKSVTSGTGMAGTASFHAYMDFENYKRAVLQHQHDLGAKGFRRMEEWCSAHIPLDPCKSMNTQNFDLWDEQCNETGSIPMVTSAPQAIPAASLPNTRPVAATLRIKRAGDMPMPVPAFREQDGAASFQEYHDFQSFKEAALRHQHDLAQKKQPNNEAWCRSHNSGLDPCNSMNTSNFKQWQTACAGDGAVAPYRCPSAAPVPLLAQARIPTAGELRIKRTTDVPPAVPSGRPTDKAGRVFDGRDSVLPGQSPGSAATGTLKDKQAMIDRLADQFGVERPTPPPAVQPGMETPVPIPTADSKASAPMLGSASVAPVLASGSGAATPATAPGSPIFAVPVHSVPPRPRTPRDPDQFMNEQASLQRCVDKGTCTLSGHPEGYKPLVYDQLGEACSLAVQVEILRTMGKPFVLHYPDGHSVLLDPRKHSASQMEDALYDYARKKGYFFGKRMQEGSGTDFMGRGHILEDLGFKVSKNNNGIHVSRSGTSSKINDFFSSDNSESKLNDVATALDAGHFVTVTLNPKGLWRSSKIRGTHDVLVTGVVKRDGKVMGVYVNDTGTVHAGEKAGFLVPYAYFKEAWEFTNEESVDFTPPANYRIPS